MASKEKGNNPSSASEGSNEENTILGDATGAKRDPPKEPDIPSGASGLDEDGKRIRPPQTIVGSITPRQKIMPLWQFFELLHL